MELKAMKERCEIKDCLPSTGIFIRAKNPDGKYESLDINVLDKESLLSWLRSRGGNNEWAENVVGILLGHNNLIK